jgi:archaeal flagellar protein FlaJ
MIEPTLKKITDRLGPGESARRSDYEKCRYDVTYDIWMYRTALLSLSAFAAVLLGGSLCLAASGAYTDPLALASVPAASTGAAAIVFYARAYAVRSMKEYRGALIDADLVHAIGLMMTMAESNVPLRKMFENLSNLGNVYGDNISLEATYILSLVEEDGLDIISALRKAQSSSPSWAWQELLIGIAEVYGSGGSLYDYLLVKYHALTERKRQDVRKYKEHVQGMASVYLSLVGIASMFVSLINLVFNMAGWLSNDSFVWLDALAVVPLGSLMVVKVMRASNPEA